MTARRGYLCYTEQIVEHLIATGATLIGDFAGACYDWVESQTDEHLTSTPIADLATEYAATYDEITEADLDSLTPAQQQQLRWELTGQVPDENPYDAPEYAEAERLGEQQAWMREQAAMQPGWHHPECQCNACYYGADLARWAFHASEY